RERAVAQECADATRYRTGYQHAAVRHGKHDVIAHAGHPRLGNANHAVARLRQIRRDEAAEAQRHPAGDDADLVSVVEFRTGRLDPFRYAASQRSPPAWQADEAARGVALGKRSAGEHDASARKFRDVLEHAQYDEAAETVTDKVQPRRGDRAAVSSKAPRVFRKGKTNRRIGIRER